MHVNRTIVGMLLTAGALAAGCDQGAGNALATAESTLTSSPSAVPPAAPPGTVLVPGGRLVDAECFHVLPSGATVDAHGNVTSNGKVIEHHDPCTSSQMHRERSDGGVIVPTISHAWVESTYTAAVVLNGLQRFNHINATWTVPPAPSEYTNQVLYYFPSLEDLNESEEIIQPVLQYGNNGGWGGNYWTFAAWYVGPANVYTSAPITVSVGDSLYGTADALATGGFWGCSATDTTTGINTQEGIYIFAAFQSAQSGVLEVYNVADCNQYPTSSPLVFNDVEISQAGPNWDSQNWLEPNLWSLRVTKGLSPACSYNIHLQKNSNDSRGRPNNTTTVYY